MWSCRQRKEAHQLACAEVEKLKQDMVEERTKAQQEQAAEQAKLERALAEKELELKKVLGNVEECKLEVTNQVQIYKVALEASQTELEHFKESFQRLSGRVGHMM